MQNKIRVKDHNKFRLFDYLNEPNSLVKLGEVVTYNSEPNKLGVIIQTFGDGDFRTDMCGNTCIDEITFSTLEEIKNNRPELLNHL